MKKAENAKTNFWKNISQYIGDYKKNVFISVIFSFLTGIMVAIQPLIIKYIVDDGINADASNDKKMKIVFAFCILYLIISLLRMVFFGISANSTYRLMEGTLFNLRNAFFERVQSLSMSFYDKTASGELFNCVMGSPMNTIKTYLNSTIVNLPFQLVSFIISFVALFSYDWLLTLSLIIIIFIMVILNIRARQKIRSIAKEYISTENEASKYINDVIHGLEATKMYSIEDDIVEKFKMYTGSVRKKGLDRLVSMWIAHVKPESVQYLGTAFIYLLGAVLCVYRGLSTGELFAFLSSMGIILSSLTGVLNLLLEQNTASAGLEKIIDIINMKTETPEVEEGRARNIEIERESGKAKEIPCIEFENAVFGYGDKKIYDGFNCKIKNNESVGLVGVSGSGKSTFTKLAMRLYDISEGAVKLYGRNIREYNIHDMRKCFGVVPQNPFMFQCSILENIRIACPKASNIEVIKAMEMAHVHEFVNELPQGWNTIIGDGGLNLSGGQKQRIAIARAILGNPDILIFDEATSALDNVSEKLIQKSMEELMKTHTVIIVAHRLTTIRNVDRILVFKDGDIVEEGKFDELAAKDGAFKELLTFKE